MHRPRRIAARLLGVALAVAVGACNMPAPETSQTTTSPVAPSPVVSEGPGAGAIAGRVWSDVCVPAEGQGLPAGCVDTAEGQMPDGTPEAGEPGIARVFVSIGPGACPSAGLATATSSGDGTYSFAGLAAGLYCISIDPTEQDVLMTRGGAWTFPSGMPPAGIATAAVALAEGEVRGNVDFGWAYRALPTATVAPTSTPAPTLTATATPTAAVTATATISASPTQPSTDPRLHLGSPTWQDTFDSAANWPLYDDEHVRFEIGGGLLRMTASNPESWDGWMLTWVDAGDVYLEMSATTGDCGGLDRYGLMLRSSSTDKGFVGYLFGLSCNGRYSLRIWNGEAYRTLVAWTQSDRIIQGARATNRIGIWAEGSHLRLYANGNLLTEITDTTYSTGLFGVFVGSANTPDFTVEVPEIAYWTLP